MHSVLEGWNRFQWAVLSVVVAGPLLVPAQGMTVRVLAAGGAAAAALLLLRTGRQRLLRDVQDLTAAASQLADGATEQVVLPTSWPELAPLAEAMETARGKVRMRVHLLQRQREELASHLTRTEERLRDPNAEARRRRIARIPNLSAQLSVGAIESSVAVLDLSLEGGVLGVKPEHAERLVPGLPVRLLLEIDRVPFEVKDVVVLAPARGGLLDLKEWVFRFEPPLVPSSLPPALAVALELRGAERIRPLATNPVGATLVCSLGRLQADVVDVSRTGVGVGAALDARRAGRLGPSFTIQLHLPAMGEVAVLPVTLRNVAVRDDGVRMGLSFDSSAEGHQLRKIHAWLDATRRSLAA